MANEKQKKLFRASLCVFRDKSNINSGTKGTLIPAPPEHLHLPRHQMTSELLGQLMNPSNIFLEPRYPLSE